MPLQQLLQQLNIPEKEAIVYIELLKLGQTPVGSLITRTKLHRAIVYQSLEKLKDMRMASMVMKGGKQHWLATNPSVILDRVQKQQALAITAVEELERLRAQSADDVDVQILHGRTGLIESLESAIISASKCDKIIRIIGGANDVFFYNLIGDWYPQYLALLNKHQVRKQLIAPRTYSESFGMRYAQEPGNEYRFTDFNMSSPTFTRITEEMVAIEVYGNEPLIIQMKNATIAKAYLESFYLMWEQAGKA